MWAKRIGAGQSHRGQFALCHSFGDDRFLGELKQNATLSGGERLAPIGATLLVPNFIGGVFLDSSDARMSNNLLFEQA
jgi:hypothetical protein